MKQLALIFCFVLFAALLSAPCPARGSGTIVSPESRVSDYEARLMLARILSWNAETRQESLEEYRKMRSLYPGNAEVEIELAQVLMWTGSLDESFTILENAYRRDPGNSSAAAAYADIQCSLGHARVCRDLYLKALALSPERTELKLRFADKMNMWGDFYKAEALYREYLAGTHEEYQFINATLSLARTLANAQRYEESEDVYHSLIMKGPDRAKPQALQGLAETKYSEKRFEDSERYSRQALAIRPDNSEAMRTLANSLVYLRRFDEARAVFATMPGLEPRVETGRTYLKEKNYTKAQRAFESVLSADPQNIPAAFYATFPDTARTRGLVTTIVNDRSASAAALTTWGSLYASQGFFAEAIDCFKAALTRDPDYFPARMALAETLGSDRRYDGSIAAYKELNREFPQDSKILISLARVLAWSRRYNESIAVYREVRALNPADPVPYREMARTAMWAKDPDLSMDTYDAALSMLAERTTNGEEKASGAGKRIARSISLEKEAKKLSYEKHFASALPVYEKLIEENPGNEEALFDEAQVACSLGSSRLEGDIYQRILDIDPLHFLAKEGLEFQKLRNNPSVRSDYSYWNEEGRGDISRITRNRFDLSVDVPFASQYHGFFKAQRYLEQPDFDHRTYGANGFTVGFSGVVNPYISGDVAWTHKSYDSSSLGTKDTGQATMWFNINDSIKVGGGYARTDEIYNYFSLEQGIQADRLWIGAQKDFTRKLSMNGRAEYINYNDSNSGSYLGLALGYGITEHPQLFRVIFSGEYRNTRHTNEYFYDQYGNVTNIIHPYWAPQDYTAGGITFAWRHDLSKSFMCGSDQHYYDLKASFGTDSENNPYARFEGKWNYRICETLARRHKSPVPDLTAVGRTRPVGPFTIQVLTWQKIHRPRLPPRSPLLWPSRSQPWPSRRSISWSGSFSSSSAITPGMKSLLPSYSFWRKRSFSFTGSGIFWRYSRWHGQKGNSPARRSLTCSYLHSPLWRSSCLPTRNRSRSSRIRLSLFTIFPTPTSISIFLTIHATT
jgi:tetratricopeptide (TPR) repeat protein